MDISSKSPWPSGSLSNFAGHRFTIDGVECYSMEGFLQSLKFDKPHIQESVCKLVGKAAKSRGQARNRRWKEVQCLWWKGAPIARRSNEYQNLIRKAYRCMFDQSEGFRKALLATTGMNLTHRMGHRDPSHTILTEREFIDTLRYIRDDYHRNRIKEDI